MQLSWDKMYRICTYLALLEGSTVYSIWPCTPLVYCYSVCAYVRKSSFFILPRSGNFPAIASFHLRLIFLIMGFMKSHRKLMHSNGMSIIKMNTLQTVMFFHKENLGHHHAVKYAIVWSTGSEIW